MKKTVLILILLIGLGGTLYMWHMYKVTGVNLLEAGSNMFGMQNINPENQAAWQAHEDPDGAFSLRYPSYVSTGASIDARNATDPAALFLSVTAEPIGSIEQPGITPEMITETATALEGGTFGEEMEQWGIEPATQITEIAEGKYAQEYMVLSRFEVCDVTFERTAIFYNNDHRITITLHGSGALTEELSDHFTVDEENCGAVFIWDHEKKEAFYNTLAEGLGTKNAQKWYDTFDEIMNSISFEGEL
jgi:hypothetical protein